MVDWKEERIKECRGVEREKQLIEDNKAENPELSDLRLQIKEIKSEIEMKEKPYNVEIAKYNTQIQIIKEELINRWDIDGKSFKCDAGTATLRTTKSLIITDNWKLIDRLTELLNDRRKACDCIRTFDLGTIRKYMDVDLIAGHIAHYDEKKNVVISAVKEDEG